MKKILVLLVLFLTCNFLTFVYSDEMSLKTENTKWTDSYIKGKMLVDRALTYVGTPYKWGSTGPKSFDCSGFVQYLYKQDSIKLNRTSRHQYYNGVHVDRDSLQPGDVIFFARNSSPKSIYHVGIIVDSDSIESTFIHSSRGGVKVSKLAGYYEKRYYTARRIFC